MGLGDLFRRRRERESAIPPSSTEMDAIGSFAKGDDQPVIGQPVQGGGGFGSLGANLPGMSGDFNLTDLPGMFKSLKQLQEMAPELTAMAQQAIAEGNYTQSPDGSIEIKAGDVNVTQEPAQTIDMRGTELGNEIREILRNHGIDPEGGAHGNIDASKMPEMQQQILDAMSRHGFNPGGK